MENNNSSKEQKGKRFFPILFIIVLLVYESFNISKFAGITEVLLTHSSKMMIPVGTDKDAASSVNDCPFANQWCQVAGDKHCYSHGNNWSQCAGDHLPYRPSSHEHLLSRKYMCLYEPFCWLQLDWEHRSPPTTSNWKCPVLLNSSNSSIKHAPTESKQFRFIDWSLHEGVLASLSSTLIESFHQRGMVWNCNTKNSSQSSKNYHYQFQNCITRPQIMQRKWSDFPTSNDKYKVAESFHHWAKTDAFGKSMDVNIVGFVPSLFEFLMAMNQTIFLHLNHRSDMFRCTKNASQDNFQNLIRLASSGLTGTFQDAPLHIVAPQYLHDTEYIRHYTGIRPIFLPFSLQRILPKNSYSGVKNMTFLWNTQHFPVPQELLDSKFQFWSPRRYELIDLLEYRAVIHMPYSTTNTKILEQYEMNIPIFAPVPKFALELGLFGDRTATRTPYCPKLTDEEHAKPHPSSPYEFSPNVRFRFDGEEAYQDELFWIQFAEIYRWPCIEYFVSWGDLLAKLEKYDKEQGEHYSTMSNCTKQANLWRKFELDTNLCWVMEQLTNSSNRVAGRILDESLNFEQTLEALYGTSKLWN